MFEVWVCFLTCCTPVPIYQLSIIHRIHRQGFIWRGIFEVQAVLFAFRLFRQIASRPFQCSMLVNPSAVSLSWPSLCCFQPCSLPTLFLPFPPSNVTFSRHFSTFPARLWDSMSFQGTSPTYRYKTTRVCWRLGTWCRSGRPHAIRIDGCIYRTTNCCEGTGCCPNGIAEVVQGQKVTWTSETELVIVAPQATSRKYARGDSRPWICHGYVLCPACAVEIDPVCFVKSNQIRVFWMVILHRQQLWPRLPRTVAFVHGHRWLQFGPQNGNCTNLDRIVQLRPFLNEDIFTGIYLSLWCIFQLIFYFPPWDS